MQRSTNHTTARTDSKQLEISRRIRFLVCRTTLLINVVPFVKGGDVLLMNRFIDSFIHSFIHPSIHEKRVTDCGVYNIQSRWAVLVVSRRLSSFIPLLRLPFPRSPEPTSKQKWPRKSECASARYDTRGFECRSRDSHHTMHGFHHISFHHERHIGCSMICFFFAHAFYSVPPPLLES